MNRLECEQLVESYVEWIKKGLSVAQLQDACELTTPFLDRHNDHLQIYAQKKDGKILITDDGYILADLETSGMDLLTPKRRAVLETMLKGYGVRMEEDRLIVDATPRNLGQRIHSLVQAMLSINDMFVMAQPRVSGFFWEDVRGFLDENRIRYSPRVKISGRSGFDQAIDFLIPKSQSRPERLIQAINTPSKNTIGFYLFSLSDTREARVDASEAYAFLNDQDRKVGGEIMDALQVYEVKPVIWSGRQQAVHALAE
ncbi:MAG: DUF1828 domain-containing protein [Nitrospirae bacterium]|nr:DUF1828 domain-containing protein [Nitrospirota bacterium]